MAFNIFGIRLGLSTLLSVPATVGVVGAMAYVIHVGEVFFPEKTTFELSSISPDVEQSESRTNRRSQARRRENNTKPPPIKKLKISKADISIDSVNLDVAPPANPTAGRVSAFGAIPIAINDRDALPIRPPPRKYPQRALEKGLQGKCDVKFDVDIRGKPYNIEATCTNSVFKRESEKSVSKAEFSPKVQNGKPVERRGVVYPIEFVLAD